MVKDIGKKNKEELNKMLADMQVELRNFRFGLAGSKSRDLKQGKNLKKDIARIKTALNSTK